MNVTPTAIPDVWLIEPTIHADDRGDFVETWHERRYREAGVAPRGFVQDNQARSARGVLRGLHYQVECPQGKLVRVVEGEVFDVAVDLRRSSPTFGRWVGARLSGARQEQLWVPPGFAHGFVVSSDRVDFIYKCTDYYDPSSERTLLWNDPDIGIQWPIDEGTDLIISEKDRNGVRWRSLEGLP